MSNERAKTSTIAVEVDRNVVFGCDVSDESWSTIKDLDLKSSKSVLQFIPLVEGKGTVKRVPSHILGCSENWSVVVRKVRNFRMRTTSGQEDETKKWNAMDRKQKEFYQARLSYLMERKCLYLTMLNYAKKRQVYEKAEKALNQKGMECSLEMMPLPKPTLSSSQLTKRASTLTVPALDATTEATAPPPSSKTAGPKRSNDRPTAAAPASAPSSTSTAATATDTTQNPSTSMSTETSTVRASAAASSTAASSRKRPGVGRTQTTTSTENRDPQTTNPKYVGLGSSLEDRQGLADSHESKSKKQRTLGVPAGRLQQQSDQKSMEALKRAMRGVALACDTTHFPDRAEHEPRHAMLLLIANEVAETKAGGGALARHKIRRRKPTLTVVTTSQDDANLVLGLFKKGLKHRVCDEVEAIKLCADSETGLVTTSVERHIEQHEVARAAPKVKPVSATHMMEILASDPKSVATKLT